MRKKLFLKNYKNKNICNNLKKNKNKIVQKNKLIKIVKYQKL